MPEKNSAAPLSDSAAGSNGTVAVQVNGSPHTAAHGSSLLEVVTALGLAGRPLAVELNEQVVPRARLGISLLAAGDRIEIVTLVGGG